ncbi:SPOR domain-containing protein [Nautilia sp.]
MANKDDLLNLNDKKPVKKPLIYGAIAFLVFIIGVLGFAIYNNSVSNKQESIVIPPQINNEEKQESMFKEVPIEEDNTSSLSEKLLKENAEQPSDTEKSAVEEQPLQAPQPQNSEINAAKPEKKVKQAKKEAKAAAAGHYYIQVAALMKYKKPNKKFLELIKQEGYGYRLYKTEYVKNGRKIEVVKILIGPFDKKTAYKNLKSVRGTISQNAFIYKVK